MCGAADVRIEEVLHTHTDWHCITDRLCNSNNLVIDDELIIKFQSNSIELIDALFFSNYPLTGRVDFFLLKNLTQ